MSEQEYEHLGDYTGFIQDGITSPFTYAVKRRDGYQPVTVLSEIDGFAWVKSSTFTTPFTCRTDNLCLVRKKPKEPREFWVNEFRRGDGTIGHSHTHDTPLDAANERSELKGWNWIRTIHVREVVEE